VKRTGEAGDCRKLHRPASPTGKALPVTEIADPTEAVDGLITIDGVLVPGTVKMALAVSPVLPFTVTI
jgi:hypothetical protein